MKAAGTSPTRHILGQRVEYVRQMRQKLDDMAQRIVEFEERQTSAGGLSTEVVQARIVDLKIKLKAGQLRLDEIKAASSWTWVDMKAGLEMALVILANACDKVPYNPDSHGRRS